MPDTLRKLMVANKVLWPLTIGVVVFVGVVTGEMGIGGGVVVGAIAILLARWFFNRLASEVSPAKANPGSSSARFTGRIDGNSECQTTPEGKSRVRKSPKRVVAEQFP